MTPGDTPLGGRRYWLAVIGGVAARDLARGGWRCLDASSDDPLGEGDRVAVLTTRRTSSIESARFIGTAEVRMPEPGGAVIRHRFVAPEGHEARLGDVPSLHARAGWTDERLAAALGTLRLLDEADYGRIESVMRDRALRFGPGPARRAHRRPRTPGRRAILWARVAARKPIAPR